MSASESDRPAATGADGASPVGAVVADLLMENTTEGIAVLDRAGRIVAANRVFGQLTGWPRPAMLGRPLREVAPVRTTDGEDLAARFCPLDRLLTELDGCFTCEGRLTTREGEELSIWVTLAARRDDRQRTVGVLIVRDLTQQRELEDLRSTFLSVVSHELQTPITIIQGYASTLRREDATWDQQTVRHGLEVIEGEAERLEKLVKRLLYISRIEVGALPMETGPVQIASLARRVVRRMEVKLGGNHQFHLSFSPDLPLVIADKEKIEEVLYNLLDNAIKYSPAGGVITVEGWATGEEVVVAVTDEGVGIPLRERERIFNRFHRVDSSLARATPGAGLGLFICRAIVAAHGGRIWVESAPGRGSRFVFSLPREEKAQLPMVSFARPGPPAHLPRPGRPTT